MKKLSPFNLSYKDISKITINNQEFNMWMIKPNNFNPKKIPFTYLSVFRSWIARG